jgi:acyl carrier protein
MQSGDANEVLSTLQIDLGEDSSDSEDPEFFWQLGDRYNYAVKVSWSLDSREGKFDVEFVDRAQEAIADQALRNTDSHGAEAVSWHRYANDPSALEAREITSDIRQSLRARLPDYLVPSAFVILRRFPLTPNGKLDRAALPAPDFGTLTSASYEVPSGEVEQTLAEIWEDLLQVQRIGRRGNFFELGGHSLIAMKLIVRIAERFSIQIPVVSVFQHPTIEELAQLIEKTRLLQLLADTPSPVGMEGSESGGAV